MRIEVSPEQVRAAFAQFHGQDVFAESTALVEAGGLPVEMIQALCLRPELLRAFAATGPGLYPGGLLERALKEKVILFSSQANACQFCTDSHRALMRAVGIPPAQIDDLENPAHLTPRERLALAYTEAVRADANRVSDALFAELKGAFSDAEIVELTLLIGFINQLNWFNNALRVTFHQEYAENR